MKAIQTKQDGNFTKHYLHDREAKLYYGIELEFDGYHATTTASSVATNIVQDFKQAGIEAYQEYDGSLHSGREIVLHPCTYSVLESRSHLFVKAFRSLNRAGYNNDNNKAGGHIHITRRALGKSKEAQSQVIDNIIAFFKKHRQGIIKLSNRSVARFNQWSAIYDNYDYPTESDMRERYPNRRYQAVNLCNRKTIEFRIFQGWTDTNSLLASLQFIKLVVSRAKAKHIDLLGYNTLNDFIEENCKSHKDLATYWRSL